MNPRLFILSIIVSWCCLLLAGCTSTSTMGTVSLNDASPASSNTPPALTQEQTPPYTSTLSIYVGNQATATAFGYATAQAEHTSIAAFRHATAQAARTATPAIRLTEIMPTFVKDRPLSESGPWIINYDMSTVANLDGTGETPWLDYPAIADAIRPGSSVAGGMTIAYITQSPNNEKDVFLKLTTGLHKEPVTITQLSNSDVDIDRGAFSVAWSPDGSKLAFTGAIQGKSLDVYAYDLATKAITRLTDGPLDAALVGWSDDGRYVIHYAADLSFIGEGGPWWDGIWSARADGRGAISLLPANEHSWNIEVLGWLNPTELRIGLENYDEQNNQTHSYYVANIETGATTPVISGRYNNLAYAKEYGIWFMSERISDTEYRSFLYQNGERHDLPGYDFSSADWFGDYDRFVGIARDGNLYTISPDGKVDSMSINLVPDKSDQAEGMYPKIHESPDKTLWLWYDYVPYQGYTAMWIGEPMLAPRSLIPPVGYLHGIWWSPDSQYIAFLGDERCIARRPSFEFECVEGESNIWSSPLLLP